MIVLAPTARMEMLGLLLSKLILYTVKINCILITTQAPSGGVQVRKKSIRGCLSSLSFSQSKGAEWWWWWSGMPGMAGVISSHKQATRFPVFPASLVVRLGPHD